MKTAVHQLISDLLTGKIIDVLSNQDKYFEMERTQIVEAYEEGYHCESSTKIDGEEYFRNTFDCYCVNQFLGQDKCSKNNCCK